MAAVVGATGWDALVSLLQVMLGFYLTCALFVLVLLGTLLRLVAKLGVLALLRYLAREFLLIVSTSSSESALPRLIARTEHLGVARPTVGITVPTGYSFNLDGTAIHLTMASLFVAEAVGTPLWVNEQIGLLVFMIVASKGAAGVTGAGLATLAAGLQSHRPDLVDGVGLVVGIDRFMSEARALTNFAGNAVACVLIGTWTGTLDRARVTAVLNGDAPFDEATMLDDHPTPDGRPVSDERRPGGGVGGEGLRADAEPRNGPGGRRAVRRAVPLTRAPLPHHPTDPPAVVPDPEHPSGPGPRPPSAPIPVTPPDTRNSGGPESARPASGRPASGRLRPPLSRPGPRG